MKPPCFSNIHSQVVVYKVGIGEMTTNKTDIIVQLIFQCGSKVFFVNVFNLLAAMGK